MDRPLWQIFLSMLFVAFVIQRAAIAVSVVLAGGSPVFLAGVALQCVLGLSIAIGIWRGRRWAIACLLALGVCIAFTSLFVSVGLGIHSAAASASEVLVALVSCGALALVLNHEFRLAPGSSGSRPTSTR